jgi:N-acetylgalactosamine-N,N'-diacetylbacillosaminyl-diphospho-undecaprenol 4-alpha-N-acetylgalactosaminyltransferase
MSHKKRVVFIINSLTVGGAERVMCTFLGASALERNEFEISLVLLDDEESPYRLPDWVKVHQLDSRQSLWRSAMLLLPLFWRLRPDVSVSFLTRANVANVLVSFFWGNPCIISERVHTSSHFSKGLVGRLAKLLVRTIYPRATKIVAVSRGVAQDLQSAFSVPESKIAVIANPIDVVSIQAHAHEAAAIELAPPYVMAMGRLVKSKNFALLIDAFGRSGLRGKLIILGDGPERETLMRKAAELGLSSRVLMPGFAKNPFALLRHADVFVLPSNAEGFPNGLLEAMAVGIPVISTNCGSGPSEILADRDRAEVDGLYFAEYGVLVPMESAELMAKALLAMTDSGLRQRYSKKAAERASEFTVDQAKRRYWDLVRIELAGRPAADIDRRRAGFGG